MDTYAWIEILNRIRYILTDFFLPLGSIAIIGVVVYKIFQARYRSKHLRYFEDRLERLESKIDALIASSARAPELESRLRVLEDIVVDEELRKP